MFRALKKIPLFKLLAIGEIVLLAGRHLSRLTPAERRRFVELMRAGRGSRRRLPEPQQAELSDLVAKAEPRLFAGTVAQKLSPVRLPRRLVHGPRRDPDQVGSGAGG
ncbi:MAG: hypothetical protein ACJ760_06010 [Thermoleophilaceae bacterium]